MNWGERGDYYCPLNRQWALEARGWTIAGIDEAGRGPWAGPVVAAAVVLPGERAALLSGLTDSKQLTPRQRERLEGAIDELACDWAVGEARSGEIDTLGITAAVSLAVERALLSLASRPAFLLADSRALPRLPWPGESIVRGDQTYACIAAASVLAKLRRDRIMEEWHQTYPQYGFNRHKGYGTALHQEALTTHGPCPLHRRSFKPVSVTLGKVAGSQGKQR